jgi:lysozyme inhibitor LprI
MKNGIRLAAALLAAVLPAWAAAGAMEECDGAGDPAAAMKCLATLDGETQAALKQADTAAGRAARDVEVASKRPGAYTAFASSSRAFALYQQAQCDYVRTMHPGADAPQTNVSSPADIARTACRIDLARDRIEILK